MPRLYSVNSFTWVAKRLATYTNEVGDLVTLKKCFKSALDELNIMPMKVMVFNGGRRRAISSPNSRMSNGAANIERPMSTPPSTSGW